MKKVTIWYQELGLDGQVRLNTQLYGGDTLSVDFNEKGFYVVADGEIKAIFKTEFFIRCEFSK